MCTMAIICQGDQHFRCEAQFGCGYASLAWQLNTEDKQLAMAMSTENNT